jgi:hypothetical protein
LWQVRSTIQLQVSDRGNGGKAAILGRAGPLYTDLQSVATKMGQIFKACSEGDLADRPEAHRRIGHVAVAA